MEEIYITDEKGKNHLAGQLKDNVFRKRVELSKHLFKKYNAWGIDAEVLQHRLQRDTEVRILDTEENKIYSSTVDDIIQKGLYEHFIPHKPQIFLPRNKWKVEEYKK